MTKKDYEVIAEVLRNSKAPQNVVIAMASKLEAVNPNFKKALFVAKCISVEDIQI